MTRSNGVVLWEGGSPIDGGPLVAIATGLSRKSKNPKTGNMVQSWIMRSDLNPVAAIKTFKDVSGCGGCVHRLNPKTGKRSCYVKVEHATLSIYRAYRKGSYPLVDWDSWAVQAAGRYGRLGAYGDPACVPVGIWEKFVEPLAGHTGYTHQASNPKLREVLKFCQVSADSLQDAQAARAAGVGSFRVLAADSPPRQPWEMLCPASSEYGEEKTTCKDCLACSGAGGAHVVINDHSRGSHYRETNRRPLQLPVVPHA